MTNRTLSLALSALIPIALAACGKEETVPLDSAKVRSSLRETARTHAQDGAGMLADFLEQGFVERAYGELCPLTGAAEEECAAPPIEVNQADLEAAVDDIVDTFFADDRVVSETPTEVIYAVDPADVCGSDAECIDALGRLGLQIVASEPSPGNIDLTVRASGHDVLVLRLHQDRIALELDLGEARAVVADHPDLFDLAPQDVPTASGRVRLALERVSARHYRAELAVIDRIDIQQPGTFQVSVDPATVLSLDADADAQSVVASIGIDRVSAMLPAEALDLGQGVARIELGGLTASADLANVQQRLSITGLSLGRTTSSLALDGVDLVTVDLNEGFGRELDLTIDAAGDQVEISFAPAASLATGLFLQPLADRGQEVPAWALDSENLIHFTAVQGAPALTLSDESLRVENGTLELSSSAMAASITIEAGMCIEADDTLDLDAIHPFSAVYGATCP